MYLHNIADLCNSNKLLMRLTIICFLFLSSMGFGQKALNSSITKGFQKPKAEMTFEKELIELGAVKKGDKRSFKFEFTNTGREAIEIEIVSACECSTLDWPIKPIKPGENAEITVDFDSTEKEESETIDIDIFLKNTDPESGAPIIEMLQYKYELIQ